MTIQEKKGRLKGLTLAYLGDSNNNVTHSLLFGCAKMGMNIRIGCPAGRRVRARQEGAQRGASGSARRPARR